MTTSGTVSQTVFTNRQVIDHAYRRCRLTAQQITSEMISIANDQLYLLLSNLANRGVPLWCIEREVLPLYVGNANVALPASTVDVLNTNLRTLQQISATQTTTSTTSTIYQGGGVTLTSVGIFWSGTSVPFVVEQSADSVTWTSIATTPTTTAPTQVAGEWTWVDLNVAQTNSYFRVRATSGTLSAAEVYFGNTPNEIPIARLNRDDWTALPNKSFQGRPLQFWFDRQINQPYMRLWPCPNPQATYQQIVLWRQRYIQDVGTMTQTLDIPQRWYDAVVAMLAAKVAQETPEVDMGLIPILDAKAEKALQEAEYEERDNSPIYWAPLISPYTR